MLKQIYTWKRKPQEIYNGGIKMVLCHNGRNIHTPVTCKDFISDIFWLNRKRKEGDARKSISIYQFSYWNRLDLLALNEYEVYMFLTNNPIILDNAAYIQSFLNEVEVKLNIPYSTVVSQTIKEKQGVLVTFDKKWTERPYLISLFLLLLRIAPLYRNEDMYDFLEDVINRNRSVHHLNCMDGEYLRDALPFIKMLCEEQIECNQEWSDELKMHHDYGGVVSFAKQFLHSRGLRTYPF